MVDLTWRHLQRGSWFRMPSPYTPPKSLATLDGAIVDPEIALKFEMGVHLKYSMHKPHIYILWKITCDSIFDNRDKEISTDTFSVALSS